MSYEEGHYWSSNSYLTFGTSKLTDEQLQRFLSETLPDHNFTSGQLLSGIESRTMQGNADLFAIAKLVRASDELSYLVIVTPAKFLMNTLREHPAAGEVVAEIEQYLATYGHQGYSLDFVEPTQTEDPSGLLATLKAMVGDKDYDPERQRAKAAAIRTEKLEQISALLSGLEYWQFRHRRWMARRYAHVREELAFLFGYCWSVLRPMALELGRRLVEAGTFVNAEDTFYLVTEGAEPGGRGASVGHGPPSIGRVGGPATRAARGPQKASCANRRSRRREE